MSLLRSQAKKAFPSLLSCHPAWRLRTLATSSGSRVTPLPKTFAVADISSFIGSDGEKAFKFDVSPYEVFNCEAPSTKVSLTKRELLNMYYNMVVIRRMEMASDALYKAKLIRGFCHLSSGQEAVAVGMESAIEKADKIITAYRCHGFALMRGGTVLNILAELLGRKDGISKGKGGSMHMFAPNFYGGNGIVGAQVPLGAGLAFAQHYRDDKNVTFALYGDGAANQGQVFESYNMAQLWKLPIIFVCENNLYGMGTSAKRASAMGEFYKRGQYIPGIRVNGMDILSIRQACDFAKQRSLHPDTAGPLVMEMVTYRYGGHSMSDPGTTYRTREEIQNMRSKNDPITGLKHRLMESNVVTENELKALDKHARVHVDEAVVAAKSSPEPDLSELWTEIYAKGTEPPSLRGLESQEIHRFQ